VSLPVESRCWPEDPDWLDGRVQLTVPFDAGTSAAIVWGAELLSPDGKPLLGVVSSGSPFAVRFRVELDDAPQWRKARGTWSFDLTFSPVGRGSGFVLSEALPDGVLQSSGWRADEARCVEVSYTVPAGGLPSLAAGQIYEIGATIELLNARGVAGRVVGTESLDAYRILGDRSEREHVRWLADEPVGLREDELGRIGVANVLLQQLKSIVEEFSGLSFLVHIDGPWGAGKSTLMRFVRESVIAEEPTTREPRWLAVSYDAWRQSHAGAPWLTLLQAVRAEVRKDQRWPTGRAWFWLRERTRLVSGWQWIALFITLGTAAGVAAFIANGSSHLTLTKWSDLVKLAGGLVSLVAAIWLVAGSAGRFMALDSRRSANNFVDTRADPMEDLAAHFEWIMQQAHGPILLLIDDLDRCPESFVVELLDAVQKLMRDRNSNVSVRATRNEVPNLLVLVAADSRWIRSSYDNAYASLARAVSEPGASIGSLFLEKLFQLTVPVPRLSDDLKGEYLAELLSEKSGKRRAPPTHAADPDLLKRLTVAPHGQLLDVLASVPPIERVRASQVAIERLVVEPQAQEQTRHALEAFSSLLDPTPRAMKRFVMAYSILRAVRTAEGSVVGVGPLALWTVLLTRWPMLAEYLQTSPESVHLFQVTVERIPSSTPPELVTLFSDPPNELRLVMNHRAGPLDERVIRECSGQPLRITS
jgi:hypothetical protein